MIHDFVSDGEISLRALTPEDVDQFRIWRNQPRIRHFTREFRPLTHWDQARWFQSVSDPNTKHFMFAVWNTEGVDTHLIGCVGLTYWNARDRHAEVSYYLGAKTGRGYALRALTLLHDWGFDELNLHRIFAEAYSDNERSSQLLNLLGYQEEGLLREHAWRNGAWVDSVMLGLLRDDWIAWKRSKAIVRETVNANQADE